MSEQRKPDFHEDFSQLLDRLGIDQWDLVLIGDGSGSRWGYAAGWACVAIERLSFERRLFYGAANNATVNIAEMMAYLAPLSWYAAECERRAGKAEVGEKNIHIITDSEYVQHMGEREGSVDVRRNTILWAAFELINRHGYRLHWCHVPREDHALNHYVDAISKSARLVLKDNDLRSLASQQGLNLDEANPFI